MIFSQIYISGWFSVVNSVLSLKGFWGPLKGSWHGRQKNFSISNLRDTILNKLSEAPLINMFALPNLKYHGLGSRGGVCTSWRKSTSNRFLKAFPRKCSQKGFWGLLKGSQHGRQKNFSNSNLRDTISNKLSVGSLINMFALADPKYYSLGTHGGACNSWRKLTLNRFLKGFPRKCL